MIALVRCRYNPEEHIYTLCIEDEAELSKHGCRYCGPPWTDDPAPSKADTGLDLIGEEL